MQRADFDSKFLRFLQMDLYHFHNNKHKKGIIQRLFNGFSSFLLPTSHYR